MATREIATSLFAQLVGSPEEMLEVPDAECIVFLADALFFGGHGSYDTEYFSRVYKEEATVPGTKITAEGFYKHLRKFENPL